MDSPLQPPGGGCPSSSATSGAWSPWKGHRPGLSSSESHGVGGRHKARPLGSSHRFQPGPGGLWAAVSLAKTPQTPQQRLAGELDHPLASPTASFGCPPPSSPVAFPGFGGGGCQYYTAAAFPGAGLGGLLVPSPLPKKPGTVYGAWSLIDVFVHYKFCSRIFFKTFAGFGFFFFPLFVWFFCKLYFCIFNCYLKILIMRLFC